MGFAVLAVAPDRPAVSRSRQPTTVTVRAAELALVCVDGWVDDGWVEGDWAVGDCADEDAGRGS